MIVIDFSLLRNPYGEICYLLRYMLRFGKLYEWVSVWS